MVLPKNTIIVKTISENIIFALSFPAHYHFQPHVFNRRSRQIRLNFFSANSCEHAPAEGNLVLPFHRPPQKPNQRRPFQEIPIHVSFHSLRLDFSIRILHACSWESILCFSHHAHILVLFLSPFHQSCVDIIPIFRFHHPCVLLSMTCASHHPAIVTSVTSFHHPSQGPWMQRSIFWLYHNPCMVDSISFSGLWRRSSGGASASHLPGCKLLGCHDFHWRSLLQGQVQIHM